MHIELHVYLGHNAPGGIVAYAFSDEFLDILEEDRIQGHGESKEGCFHVLDAPVASYLAQDLLHLCLVSFLRSRFGDDQVHL